MVAWNILIHRVGFFIRISSPRNPRMLDKLAVYLDPPARTVELKPARFLRRFSSQSTDAKFPASETRSVLEYRVDQMSRRQRYPYLVLKKQMVWR